MFTKYFQVVITIKIVQHTESRLLQTSLKPTEYEADPKTNNGTQETHSCQINMNEKPNSKLGEPHKKPQCYLNQILSVLKGH